MELAYNTLLAEDLEPKGFAFWNILDEGRVPPIGDYIHDIDIDIDDSEDKNVEDKTENKIENTTENKTKESQPLWLAGSLNKFMKIRK